MEIYGLTKIGFRLARSTKSPNTLEWQIIHYLDKVNRATKDQIATYTGVNQHELSRSLNKLKAKGIIAIEMGVTP